MFEKPKVVFGKPIAILVDGSFCLKRYNACFPGGNKHDPSMVASNLYTMFMSHVEGEELYRIFFYDCPPLEKKLLHPLSGKTLDFGVSDVAKFRRAIHSELSKKRKVALRLGTVRDTPGHWNIDPAKLKGLLKGTLGLKDLNTRDVTPELRQKGVDMRLGLDIASLAFKKLVKRIILITGDSDFVPAAKLARREGLDVILDPMWQAVSPDLFLHIDGLVSKCKRPLRAKSKVATAKAPQPVASRSKTTK